ncbi:MAG: outer membrane protein transport protein [Verrucomicrobiota bacterium]|nr:outer membrane protein transport protein [Verrucomicrobiota bacterium]
MNCFPRRLYRFSTWILSAALLILTPSSIYALGIRIADQSAAATARGNAFSATADDPSAIYYNPAGITQLDGTHALLGAYTISLEARVNPPGPASNFDSKYEIQPVPHAYFTWKAETGPIALGLGLYSPYGFGLEYPDDTPFRTLAKKGRIQYLTVNPVFAWKITDSLSIGAGPTINYSRIKLAQGVINPGDEFLFEGEGVGYGFNVGVLWQPHQMHSFGLTYRSATRVTYSGHTRLRIPAFTVPTPFGPFPVARTETEEDADFVFNFPQNIVFGYSFRPTPDWNLEFNLDWTDWDSLNTLRIKQQSARIATPFNWESSFFYEFGLTRKLPRGFHVSAGYIYSENSVPNESFNPLVPDSNRHIFSIGVGQKLARVNWDIAYQYAYGPLRTIENGTLANGVYRFESHALNLSVGFTF